EGDAVTFVIQLSSSDLISTDSYAVNLFTELGSATPGVNYTALPTTLRILDASNGWRTSITVTTLQDSENPGDVDVGGHDGTFLLTADVIDSPGSIPVGNRSITNTILELPPPIVAPTLQNMAFLSSDVYAAHPVGGNGWTTLQTFSDGGEFQAEAYI